MSAVLREMTSFQLSLFNIVPVIIGTMFFRKFPPYARFFVFFFCLSMIVDFGSYVVGTIYHQNNMPGIYLFVIIAGPLLGYAYSKLLSKVDVFHLSFMVPVLAIAEGLMSGFYTFSSYSFVVLNLMITILALYTFSKMVVDGADPAVYWLNGTLFFYAVSSSVVFFSAKYLQDADVDLMQELFSIHSYINATTNLFFGYSLWTLSKSYSSAR